MRAAERPLLLLGVMSFFPNLNQVISLLLPLPPSHLLPLGPPFLPAPLGLVGQ